MRYAELFAGAGGLSRGLDAAGMHAAWHAEIEPHARAVLRRQWPDVPLYGDVRLINGRDMVAQHGPVSLLAAGFPCQDLSVAGKRAGLGGSRSSLFHDCVRIWGELNAPYLILENVYGLLSSNRGADFALVLSTLVGAPVAVPRDGWRRGGVVAGPDAVAAWRVLDLQHFGPPQRRVRVFVVAARAGGVDPAEVLALGEGVCGHPSPRDCAREGAAAGAGGGAAGGGLAAFQNTGQGWWNDAPVAQSLRTPLGSGSLEANVVVPLAFGWQNSPAQPLAIDLQQVTSAANRSQPAPTAPTLNQAGNVIAFNPVVCATGDITHALRAEGCDASEDGTGRGTPIVVGNSGMERCGVTDTASTLAARDAKGGNPLALHGRPRRLTPRECERLMSWPDDWTALGTDEAGREYRLSDTARYRLCGNGVGSVCVEWFARRLMALESAA